MCSPVSTSATFTRGTKCFDSRRHSAAYAITTTTLNTARIHLSLSSLAMDLLRRSLVCLLILTLLSPTTLSMRFELHSDQMKCISEDIYEKSISVGKYFIVNPNEDHPLSASHKVIVKVVGTWNVSPWSLLFITRAGILKLIKKFI